MGKVPAAFKAHQFGKGRSKASAKSAGGKPAQTTKTRGGSGKVIRKMPRAK